MNATPRRDHHTQEDAYQAFYGSPAQITDKELDEIEWALQFGGLGINRRAGLGLLLKSGKELTQWAEDRDGALTIAASAKAAGMAPSTCVASLPAWIPPRCGPSRRSATARTCRRLNGKEEDMPGVPQVRPQSGQAGAIP